MRAILLIPVAGMSMVCSAKLAWTSLGRPAKVSPFFLFVATSILFINVGFLLRFAQHPVEPWSARALIAVSVGLLMASLGGTAGVVIVRGKRPPQVIREPDVSDFPYPVACVAACVVFGTVLLYYYMLGYVPLAEGLRLFLAHGLDRGLLNSLRIARDVYVDPHARYIPLQGFMEATRYFGLPVVAIWFAHYWRSGVRPFTSCSMVVFSLLLSMSSGQRWPLMYMCTTLALYWLWTQPDPTERWKGMFSISVMAFVAGSCLTILLARTFSGDLTGLETLLSGVRELVGRIVLGNNQVPFYSYQLFPMEQGWLYGRSWLQNLLTYLPGPMASYPVTFYRLVTGDLRGFSAPPDFFTEAYINFGWPGVAAIPFWWGLLLSSVHRAWQRGSNSLLYVSVRALIATSLGFTAFSGAVMALAALIVSVFIVLVVRGQTCLARRRQRCRWLARQVGTPS